MDARHIAAAIGTLIGLVGFPGAPGPAGRDTPAVAPARLRPAMLVWRVGTNEPEGPSPMIEAITRTTYGGRPVWRVTHYDENPAASKTGDFDLYDVDATTLSPIRSVMRNPGFSLELTFRPGEVEYRRVAESATSVERIPLATPVMAEGPGMRVLVASLPLREGYSTRFQVVDRWSGEEATRVKPLTLSVTGRGRSSTPMGPRDTFAVRLEADDGAFHIVQHVRTEAPHYPFLVEYVRGKTVLKSDVTAMAIEGQSPKQ